MKNAKISWTRKESYLDEVSRKEMCQKFIEMCQSSSMDEGDLLKRKPARATKDDVYAALEWMVQEEYMEVEVILSMINYKRYVKYTATDKGLLYSRFD